MNKGSGFYIDNSEDPYYRYTKLLSLDTLEHSIRNLIVYITGAETFYDREGNHFSNKISEKDKIERYQQGISRLTEEFIKDEYRYSDNYLSILKSLKSNNPNTDIVVFTSPITADMLASIINNGDKLEEYKKWLNDLVDVFGKINHFMDFNSITINLDNYPDLDHYYDDVADLIINKILKKNTGVPDDFGVLLERENISEYLNHFEDTLKNYKPL